MRWPRPPTCQPIAGSGKAELIAICDNETGKLRALRERTGVVHATTSLDEMLSLDDLDAVDICLPSHEHAAAVIRCLEAGKHVLCEKPLGLTSGEVDEVLAAHEKSGRHLVVGMNNRYRDDSILLRNFIQDGALGDVFHARAGGSSGASGSSQAHGSTIARSPAAAGDGPGIQLIDLVLWLAATRGPRRTASFYYHTPGIDVEDTAVIALTCAGGLSISLDVSWHFHVDKLEYDHFVELYGTSGSGPLNLLRVFQHLYASSST